MSGLDGYTRAEVLGVYPVQIGGERVPAFVMLVEGADWGGRVLPIFIGIPEALAIDRALKGVETERPMTHDLLVDVVEALEARVVRVTIDALLESSVYTATLVLGRGEDGGEKLYYVDARPSDAVAVALRAGAPIYVAERLRKYARAPEGRLQYGGEDTVWVE